MWLSFPPSMCVCFVDVLWHCSALACSRLWDRPVVWGAGSTPPALCLSTSRKKGDFAPAIVQIPGNLQSQSPPFVLGQQWLRPLQLGQDRQVLPGRSQWLYIIDVSHRWVPFFSPLGHWLEKNVKVEPKMWSMAARTLLESHCGLGGGNSMAPLLSLTSVIWMASFSKCLRLCLFSYFGFSLLFCSSLYLTWAEGKW